MLDTGLLFVRKTVSKKHVQHARRRIPQHTHVPSHMQRLEHVQVHAFKLCGHTGWLLTVIRLVAPPSTFTANGRSSIGHKSDTDSVCRVSVHIYHVI